MKSISILGSTGSIGKSTLAVVDAFPDQLRVCGLAAGANVELLAEQVERYRPVLVSVRSAANIPSSTDRSSRMNAAMISSMIRMQSTTGTS